MKRRSFLKAVSSAVGGSAVGVSSVVSGQPPAVVC